MRGGGTMTADEGRAGRRAKRARAQQDRLAREATASGGWAEDDDGTEGFVDGFIGRQRPPPRAEDAEEDPSVRLAMRLERKERARAERLAREGCGGLVDGLVGPPSPPRAEDAEEDPSVRLAMRLERKERARIQALIAASDANHGGRDVLQEHRRSVGQLLRDQPRISGYPVRITKVTANPHATPGSELYERFLASWSFAANSTVQLAFHGTSEANIASILSGGLVSPDPALEGAGSEVHSALGTQAEPFAIIIPRGTGMAAQLVHQRRRVELEFDPARRNGQSHGAGEYFAGNFATSLPYCKGGKRMLVFALLMDPGGVTVNQLSIDNGVMGQLGMEVSPDAFAGLDLSAPPRGVSMHRQGIVVIHKPTHHLPLFVIDFEY